MEPESGTTERRVPSAGKRLTFVALAVFLLGQALAVLIHFTAPEVWDGIGYEIIDGKVYAVPVHESKRYRLELERIGGKAAIFADDVNRWFSGLWKGKKLARTVSLLSIVASLALWRLGSLVLSTSDRASGFPAANDGKAQKDAEAERRPPAPIRYQKSGDRDQIS
ncbi:MAG: hypothetical protein LBL72_04800 [Candidatus Accumulibacter sp.]|jgi:hypothetical protein|nr:hypothetical protein [Accumulibacter sp.]